MFAHSCVFKLIALVRKLLAWNKRCAHGMLQNYCQEPFNWRRNIQRRRLLTQHGDVWTKYSFWEISQLVVVLFRCFIHCIVKRLLNTSYVPVRIGFNIFASMVYHNGLGMERGRLRRRETVRIVVTYGDWRINQFREDFKNIPLPQLLFIPWIYDRLAGSKHCLGLSQKPRKSYRVLSPDKRCSNYH